MLKCELLWHINCTVRVVNALNIIIIPIEASFHLLTSTDSSIEAKFEVSVDCDYSDWGKIRTSIEVEINLNQTKWDFTPKIIKCVDVNK